MFFRPSSSCDGQISYLVYSDFNPFKTTRKRFQLNIEFVPRRKLSPSRLKNQSTCVVYCKAAVGYEMSVHTKQNIHSLDRTYNFRMLNFVIYKVIAQCFIRLMCLEDTLPCSKKPFSESYSKPIILPQHPHILSKDAFYHQRLGFSSCLFPSYIPTTILYAFL